MHRGPSLTASCGSCLVFTVTLNAISLILCLVKFHPLFKIMITCPFFFLWCWGLNPGSPCMLSKCSTIEPSPITPPLFSSRHLALTTSCYLYSSIMWLLEIKSNVFPTTLKKRFYFFMCVCVCVYMCTHEECPW